MKTISCPNEACLLASARSIICYGFYNTNSGKRRRYRCQSCGKTFCANIGTPYHRLQHRRATFDQVAALSVEGLNKSAIARVKQIAWNTVARWLEKTAHSCRRFNDQRIATPAVAELQADEIRTIVGSKKQPMWIFTTIDVWSRLWPATVVGRRSYRNTLALFQDVASRMNLERIPMIVTDGFEFYKRVVRRIFGSTCLYGQVIKTRRNDRIIKVERRTLIGDTWRFEETLRDSEDSSKLNTSFVERLNLTIRQGSAYLFRRTICHARWKERLENHLELFRCYYNFVRPHWALKFGSEVRTPAMQTGLTSRRLTLRDIFPPAMLLSLSEKVKFPQSTGMPLAA
jgi:transposase-like protein/IS1 family transposase